MTDEIQGNPTNIRIASRLGVFVPKYDAEGKPYYEGEDYENDLNAMAKVESTMSDEDYSAYGKYVLNAIDKAGGTNHRKSREFFSASSKTRAEAYLAVTLS